MQFEHDGKTYEVKDVTRAERRELAALRAGMYAIKDGLVWQSGPAIYSAIQRVQRMSGLKDADLDGLTPDDENELLLALLTAYIEGLVGKGSGA